MLYCYIIVEKAEGGEKREYNTDILARNVSVHCTDAQIALYEKIWEYFRVNS